MKAEPSFRCRIAVLTVSDTRTAEDDRSGDTLVERLVDAGHVLAARAIERDERGAIVEHLRRWCADPAIDVVLTTGGTGLTGRDVTVEAHRDVYEKEIDAFGTVFTMVSMQKIGTSAVQSRACGGRGAGDLSVRAAGQPSACRDAWDDILQWQLDYRHRPCNFVEIMPRLEEHRRRTEPWSGGRATRDFDRAVAAKHRDGQRAAVQREGRAVLGHHVGAGDQDPPVAATPRPLTPRLRLPWVRRPRSPARPSAAGAASR